MDRYILFSVNIHCKDMVTSECRRYDIRLTAHKLQKIVNTTRIYRKLSKTENWDFIFWFRCLVRSASLYTHLCHAHSNAHKPTPQFLMLEKNFNRNVLVSSTPIDGPRPLKRPQTAHKLKKILNLINVDISETIKEMWTWISRKLSKMEGIEISDLDPQALSAAQVCYATLTPTSLLNLWRPQFFC